MKSAAAILIAAGLATGGALGLAAPRQDAPPEIPPTRRVLNCTEGGCHSAQTSFEHLHGPVAANACEMCHQYVDPAAHTFKLEREGAQLCDFCHIGKTDRAGLNVHQPVLDGECITCHNPHGSDVRVLLKTQSERETCMQCHEPLLEGLDQIHTPVDDGRCLDCHKAHHSILPNLLIAEGRELCLSCHEDVVTVAAGNAAHPGGLPQAADAGAGTRTAIASDHAGGYLHEPVAGDCSQCHETHASTHQAILKDAVEPLCSSCHQPVAEKILGAEVAHSAVSADRACLNCHAAHTSPTDQLLRDDPVKVCLNCHNEPVKRADGTVVASVASIAGEHQSLHDPINQGCSDCHDVHGASHRALLTQPYTTEFYQRPVTEAYELCFSCHDQKLMTEQRTTEATKFRDGDRNLHYVHVALPGDKGRSCRVCHDTHATESARLLRKDVAFGQWEVPIDFKATENGGSCAAGCHRPYTYDRLNGPSGKAP